MCNAIGAHHNEIEMTFLLSSIIQVCDSISGARPGARRQVLESYVKRLKDLENFSSVNNVMEKYLSKPYPSRAAVEVSRLPKDVEVEIDAVIFKE